jgi:RNA polymerase sigma factor (sigma-70 family)
MTDPSQINRPVIEDPACARSADAPEVVGTARARSALTRAESDFARDCFEQHRFVLYRYLKRVLVSREDAQEILQETYLRFLRQPTFDRLRRNARAYLFQIATNLANDFFRQRALKSIEAESEVFEASGLSAPDWASWPELALQGEQTQSLILLAFSELSAPVRTALLQYRFQKLTQREIASRIGVSERTVERYIKQGLSHIAHRLKALL